MEKNEKQKLDKIKIGVGAVKAISSIGVGTIVKSACTTFVPPEAKIPVTVCCYLGAMGITGAVKMKTNDYWDSVETKLKNSKDQLDKFIEEVNKKTMLEIKKVEEPKKKKERKVKQKSEEISEEVVEIIDVEVEDVKVEDKPKKKSKKTRA